MSRSYRQACPLDCKVYVGDLGNNGDRRELEDVFGRYGPLRDVWVARNPPGFAFVEFENHADAKDASRALDGRTICGRRVRVELSSGRAKTKRYGDNGGRYDYGRDRDRRDREDRRDDRRRDSDRDRRESRRESRRSRSGDRRRSRSRSPKVEKRDKSPNSPKAERSRRNRSEEKNASDGGED